MVCTRAPCTRSSTKVHAWRKLAARTTTQWPRPLPLPLPQDTFCFRTRRGRGTSKSPYGSSLYATLFAEAGEQLIALNSGSANVDLVLVPTGVGSLLQAALTHYRSAGDARVVSVEPSEATCIAPSIDAGQPVTVETGVTVMSGPDCGTPSLLAWPLIRDGLSGAVSLDDEDAIRAAHDLASLGVAAGPYGGSGLAAAHLLLTGDGAAARRSHLGIDSSSTLLLIITEGPDANPLPG